VKYTSEPLLPQPATSQSEIPSLKTYTLLSTDQIPAELIQAGSKTAPSKIHDFLILSEIRRHTEVETGCNNYKKVYQLSTTNTHLSNILFSLEQSSDIRVHRSKSQNTMDGTSINNYS